MITSRISTDWTVMPQGLVCLVECFLERPSQRLALR